MLIRIVHMTFQPEKVKDFLVTFSKIKEKIKNFEGCEHLELLKDYHAENIFTTYSHWENETFLNQYRNSAAFREIWADTKSMFSEKPVVYSLRKFINVG